ncbi:transposase [Brucella anthropi]|uniref:transposase n=1 Tax=Brucella anthropi TaxID=529 RepID=UPI003C7CF897
MCSRHKKGTQETEALGRSRGGFTTKLHARCDAKGRPLGFVLTPGQTHDTQGFAPLFRMISDQIEGHRYFNLSKFAILSMMLILCGFQASDFTPHICGCLTQLAMVC